MARKDKNAESLAHALQALWLIKKICHGSTPGGPVDDLAQCAKLASLGIKGDPLVGDPGVYDLSDVEED